MHKAECHHLDGHQLPNVGLRAEPFLTGVKVAARGCSHIRRRWISGSTSCPNFWQLELWRPISGSASRPTKICRSANYEASGSFFLFTRPTGARFAAIRSHFTTRSALNFRTYSAEILGISVDGAWCHQAYAKHNHIHFPLLADFHPKGAAAQKYGAYREQDGVCERALFVIDRKGLIFWSYLSPIAVNPGADGILDALESLQNQEK